MSLVIGTDLEVLGWETSRQFGCPKYIPKELIQQHWNRIVTNHGKSLLELRKRGGLTPAELVCSLQDKAFAPMEEREAVKQLNAIIVARYGFRLDSRRAELQEGKLLRYAGFYANGLRGPSYGSNWEIHRVVERGIVLAHPKPHGGHEHLMEWNTLLWQLEIT